MYCALLWVDFYAGMHEQWSRFDNLAQASGSHLSESIRKPSQGLCKLSQATSSNLKREVILLRRGGLA